MPRLPAGGHARELRGHHRQRPGAQVSTPITNASCSVEFVTKVALARVRSAPASPAATSEHDDLLVAHAPAKPRRVLDYALVYTGAHGSLNGNPRFRPFRSAA